MARDTYKALQVRQISDRLDRALNAGSFQGDVRTTAIFALELCAMLSAGFNATQREAFKAAKAYWYEGVAEKRSVSVAKFAEIIRSDQTEGRDPREVAVNRLIWSSFNTSEEFSGYAGEFLIYWAIEAGLSPDQVSTILSGLIPGF
ncbi:hypothetical protein RKE25_21640 [Dyella sp. BiH032]|uniref:hypothetical protein n=1 Tax=Dyella sp. BiH032 TaxID=3075430 RepID=UPI00289377D3|nr:hypothetical protein [Dyella sp. BiH032]WNL45980.1 hypothetical protein RKE25_21640 [Dyella sp. BiH032]